MSSVGFQPLQLEDVRARLRKMSDADLLRFGARFASRLRMPAFPGLIMAQDRIRI